MTLVSGVVFFIINVIFFFVIVNKKRKKVKQRENQEITDNMKKSPTETGNHFDETNLSLEDQLEKELEKNQEMRDQIQDTPYFERQDHHFLHDQCNHVQLSLQEVLNSHSPSSSISSSSPVGIMSNGRKKNCTKRVTISDYSKNNVIQEEDFRLISDNYFIESIASSSPSVIIEGLCQERNLQFSSFQNEHLSDQQFCRDMNHGHTQHCSCVHGSFLQNQKATDAQVSSQRQISNFSGY
jgi:hypothetical protein